MDVAFAQDGELFAPNLHLESVVRVEQDRVVDLHRSHVGANGNSVSPHEAFGELRSRGNHDPRSRSSLTLALPNADEDPVSEDGDGKVVSHTPLEVETLARFQEAHGWVDLGRQLIPAPQRYYSWWSYRAKDWREGDRGRRLDHMWASPSLAPQASAHRVIEDTRDWEKCSDHVPLITEFDI